jgi:hypothetical protein
MPAAGRAVATAPPPRLASAFSLPFFRFRARTFSSLRCISHCMSGVTTTGDLPSLAAAGGGAAGVDALSTTAGCMATAALLARRGALPRETRQHLRPHLLREARLDPRAAVRRALRRTRDNPLASSDAQVANRTINPGRRSLTVSRHPPIPLQDCSSYRGLHVRRERLGVVRRARAIFSVAPVPNPDRLIRSFCIAVSLAARRVDRTRGCGVGRGQRTQRRLLLRLAPLQLHLRTRQRLLRLGELLEESQILWVWRIACGHPPACTHSVHVHCGVRRMRAAQA